jgi:hypothetical protein
MNVRYKEEYKSSLTIERRCLVLHGSMRKERQNWVEDIRYLVSLSFSTALACLLVDFLNYLCKGLKLAGRLIN